MALLEISDLTVEFYAEDGVVRALDGVSYEIEAGETVGIVGESGAGKTVACLSVLGLVDPGEVVEGSIRFGGRDLRELSASERRSLRGNEIAIAFQDAQSAFNPTLTVGEQIAETIRAHENVSDATARARAIDLLARVDVSDPASRYADYPHEFSGGMAQRAAVAMALSCDPDLLILDEPTAGLDVTVQAQLLELLADLAADSSTAIQLVSHDLGVVAERCDRVVVLYDGAVVERAPVEELFYDPRHPYTAGLLASIPRIGDDRERLPAIPGSKPDPRRRPTGCRFHPRCPDAEPVCANRDPELVDVETGAPASGEATSADGARTPTARRDSDTHLAACHAHTGALEGELGYEVRVEGDPSDEDVAGPADEDVAGPSDEDVAGPADGGGSE